MHRTVKSLGLCLGASTISAVQVSQHLVSGTPERINSKPRIVEYSSFTHGGDPRKTLCRALEEIDPGGFNAVAVTGRKFRKYTNLTTISEPEAVEYAYGFIRKTHDLRSSAIVAAGGETFMAYVLDADGRISNVLTGNKCASGTGEFFLQQLRRLDVTLEETATWETETLPYKVSGRCSVFCKSDCTHATNTGTPKSRVISGLCKMMADKVIELLRNVDRSNIMIIGGTTKNKAMIAHLRKELPGLMVPEEAPYFEALGAALWALDHDTIRFPGFDDLFAPDATAFEVLPPIQDYTAQVSFEQLPESRAQDGGEYILGLDVGSTTTKAVLMATADNSISASIYLRTNGDPVGASRQCYRAIRDQMNARSHMSRMDITGIGVCGSGRQIAGLHADTEGVINEIIAHAAAAVYFDPEVDTLFEIGGQDAKYTYITNGVASDYAMNEACSAGTGSFLEESAYESLGIGMTDIADIALQGTHPSNFNDQCAAFIASDIKNAIHEGIARADIVAGLVYSICMNYNNRVKGNRPVGRRVFMQGGVCYNKAVPLAMASLTGKEIIVPPEPGLMGAFGAALEVQKRIKTGSMQSARFDLSELAEREVTYGKTFICKGGRQKCDRRCEISRIKVNGSTHPFGGACNRYYNLRHKLRFRGEDLNFVQTRQHLIFEKYGIPEQVDARKTYRGRVGFNRSFMVNTYYPLYSVFFDELGFKPVIPDRPSQTGIDRRNAAFCHPAELAHGFFQSLLKHEEPLDYLFMPHFKSIPTQNGSHSAQLCPFVQGETYYLQTTFRREIESLTRSGVRLLTPLLDMNRGTAFLASQLVQTAGRMGVSKKEAASAFEKAMTRQRECRDEMQRIGRRLLADLESTPDKTAIVIFGRSYNAFADEAHMGVPHKIATRGIATIPLDFLPLSVEPAKRHMYWGTGQTILKAARFVKRHPQLFGTYITNFSCGPDSFLIGYFRSIMGKKPSLTLELDSHTADAGLETRIEAYLDIVSAFRNLTVRKKEYTTASGNDTGSGFTPAKVIYGKGTMSVRASSDERVRLSDERVTLLFPSMGKIASEALSAGFRGAGLNAMAHPPADEGILKLGRGNTTCKECLPLILTTGTLLNYIHFHKKPEEILLYFMPTGSGPCRFGQYQVFMEDLIKRLEIPDVAMFSLSSENGYDGLDLDIHRKAWWAVVVSDVFEDIRSMVLTNAVDLPAAMDAFDGEWDKVLLALETGRFSRLTQQLKASADSLVKLAMKKPAHQVPVISLTGEIFVRRDGLSRQYLTENLAKLGFAVTCAPVAEWVHYADHLVLSGINDHHLSMAGKLKYKAKQLVMKNDEKKIKSIMAGSALVNSESVDITTVIDIAAPYISPNLGGEAILTVGSSMMEVASRSCGVIAIGPFGCMPNRLSESILTETMRTKDKLTNGNDHRLKDVLKGMENLPFLAIESDGSPFPQLITAKLEAFCLRALRLHERMQSGVHRDGVHAHHK
ncbi:MAG: activase [Desulfobacteraceae bacterium]|nr:activase [Desulfobacteraceae bacterium]